MQTDENISVLVVDEHTLTAEMTSSWLNQIAGFTTGNADSIETAIEAIRRDGTYNVVMLDLDLPGMNGIEGLERVVAANHPGAVVIFSGQVHADLALRAIEVGARGLIPKSLPLKSFTNAVRFVAMGETYLPHSMAASVRAPTKRGKSSEALTPAEVNVIRGITRGMTNRAIGEELGLSEVTVKAHVRSICAKLAVANRTQVAMTAIARGIA